MSPIEFFPSPVSSVLSNSMHMNVAKPSLKLFDSCLLHSYIYLGFIETCSLVRWSLGKFRTFRIRLSRFSRQLSIILWLSYSTYNDYSTSLTGL